MSQVNEKLAALAKSGDSNDTSGAPLDDEHYPGNDYQGDEGDDGGATDSEDSFIPLAKPARAGAES